MSTKIRQALTRKFAGMPAWLWFAVLAVALILYRRWRGMPVGSTGVPGAGPVPYGGGVYGSSSGVGGPSLGGGSGSGGAPPPEQPQITEPLPLQSSLGGGPPPVVFDPVTNGYAAAPAAAAPATAAAGDPWGRSALAVQLDLPPGVGESAGYHGPRWGGGLPAAVVAAGLQPLPPPAPAAAAAAAGDPWGRSALAVQLDLPPGVGESAGYHGPPWSSRPTPAQVAAGLDPLPSAVSSAAALDPRAPARTPPSIGNPGGPAVAPAAPIHTDAPRLPVSNGRNGVRPDDRPGPRGVDPPSPPRPASPPRPDDRPGPRGPGTPAGGADRSAAIVRQHHARF